MSSCSLEMQGNSEPSRLVKSHLMPTSIMNMSNFQSCSPIIVNLRSGSPISIPTIMCQNWWIIHIKLNSLRNRSLAKLQNWRIGREWVIYLIATRCSIYLNPNNNIVWTSFVILPLNLQVLSKPKRIWWMTFWNCRNKACTYSSKIS